MNIIFKGFHLALLLWAALGSIALIKLLFVLSFHKTTFVNSVSIIFIGSEGLALNHCRSCVLCDLRDVMFAVSAAAFQEKRRGFSHLKCVNVVGNGEVACWADRVP